MSYLISLDLPLWVAFIPLLLAALLAYKLYQWQGIFSSVKANYQVHLRELQNRLDESIASEKNISKAFQKQAARILELESMPVRSNIEVAEREALIVELNKQVTELAEKVAKNYELAQKHAVNMSEKVKEIEQLKAEAVERESLIEQLNKQVSELKDANSFQASVIQLDDAICKDFRLEIERLKSDDELRLLKIDELIETIGNLDQERKGLQADLNAAIAVINRTERGRRQWAKHELKKSGEAVHKAVEKLQSEAVVYDSIGVPRITQADQSEDFNARNIKEVCDEVVRGVKEQTQAIRNELQAQEVDLSTLEAGDSVRYRNGLVRKVLDFGDNYDKSYPIWIKVDCQKGDADYIYGEIGYVTNGKYFILHNEKHDYDIIQIIKKSHV